MRKANLVLLMLLLATPALAQKFGKIQGVVTDAKTGEPLPGTNVLVVGTSLGAATDLEGRYVILRVPPGTYQVRANFIGYQTVVMQNVEVLTDLTTELNFSLQPETVELGEEVVIVAERPIIRKDLTSAEARVQAAEIARLPVQELGDVLDLQAGVTRDAGGGIHIRGGRSSEIAYMINGISVTDDFTRTPALQVENASVQELQVISGTFNAEYGEALSGIINVVTRTGSNQLNGTLEVWSGDYVTSRDEIFFNIDKVNPAANYNLQGTLSGPIVKDKFTFFLTGRRYYTDGWLYGANAYDPQAGFLDSLSTVVPMPADSSAVPMNFLDRWSGQATLEWRISTPFKLKIDALGSVQKRGNYKHSYKLIPRAVRNDDERGLAVIANLTHVLSNKTFYELTASYKENRLASFLYDDPLDPRYRDPRLQNTGANQFIKAGTELDRFERETRSWIAKFDLTSQVSERHQIKTGVQLKFDDVFMEDITPIPATDENGLQIEPFRPEIRPPSEPTHDRIQRRPFTFAAYLQDKIEYESFIINVGLRFDLFDARGRVPADLSDPNIYSPFKLENIYRDLNGDGVIDKDEQRPDNQLTVEEREQYWYRPTTVKTQWSPRLGIAYPITDRGVIHFSFGIFRQVPDYEQLYRGDELKVTDAVGIQGGKSGNGFGNPDLEPQRTTMYELGLQQQLSDNIGADLTLFYRDIRDWVSTGAAIETALAGVFYARRINRDFANVVGFTLSVNRRLANHYAFSLDYTFQVAEGTNSRPDEEFFTQLAGAEPTKQLTPLDWDQRHTLNATGYVGGNTWGASLVARLNSGQPYTPSIPQFRRTGRSIIGGLPKNSRTRPTLFTVDLTAHKYFSLGPARFKLFARIFNLFDAKNPVVVFSDTGRPDFTFSQLGAQADPTFFNIPSFYSKPREVQIGLSVSP